MENMFVGFKKGIKGLKIWDPTDRKFLFSRDVTFDEASILKPKVSQQVETRKTKDASQQVENDANTLFLESSASVRIIPRVTQGNDQADEVDVDDEEGQEQIMGDVSDSTTVTRPRRNTRKPGWLTADMVVTYALSVVEEAISSTDREDEISSESRMWKYAMEE